MEQYISLLTDNNIPHITQEHFCFRNVDDLRYIQSPNFFGVGLELEIRFIHNDIDVRVIGGDGFIDIDRYNDAGYTRYVAQNPDCPRYAIFTNQNGTFIINDWNRAYYGNGNIPRHPGEPETRPNTIVRSDGQVFIR